MSDVLLQIGGTKLVLSAVLACAAWMVHRRVRLPGVSYPMWLLVLVVLLVPAFMPLPVLPAAGAEVAGLELAPAGASEAAGSPASFQTAMVSWFDAIGKQGLVILWLLGSAALLGWSLLRAARFRRTLMQALEPAPPELQREAARISRRLGLARVPEVNTTHARISPMVWSTGGRVRVLIPNFVLAELSDAEVRSILAHELAHVRRRDHLVRWLELAACTGSGGTRRRGGRAATFGPQKKPVATHSLQLLPDPAPNPMRARCCASLTPHPNHPCSPRPRSLARLAESDKPNLSKGDSR